MNWSPPASVADQCAMLGYHASSHGSKAKDTARKHQSSTHTFGKVSNARFANTHSVILLSARTVN